MSIFSDADPDDYEGIHIRRVWLADVHLPTGRRRLHTGGGPLLIDGVEWEGVNDPFGAQLVGLGQVEEPEFGQAPAVDVVISGVNREFLKAIWDMRYEIEGAQCDLYFITFDVETGEPREAMETLFPGKLTGLALQLIGTSVRAISMKVVSPFEGLNFPETRFMWSPAGQRDRYAGDAGMDFIGADDIVTFKP